MSVSELLTPGERSILERLHALVTAAEFRRNVEPVITRVQAALAASPREIEAWEPLPLSLYSRELPDSIRSSWVFILRAGSVTGAERHPNSRQRMISFRGHGDFQTHDGERWRSHPLVSDPAAKLEGRWISIPPLVWHQGVVPEENWVVVSFHTVPAGELIEERPEPGSLSDTRARKYVES